MPIAAAGIGAGGSILGGLIGGNAASNAADAQTQAAYAAIAAQKQAAADNQHFQEWMYGTTRNDLGPYRAVGENAIVKLSDLMNNGGFPDWTGKFVAPTDITEQNDPGFMARLKLGQDALQNSAAAKGNLLTGGTARALNQSAQDYASNEYGNVYGRAFNQYLQGYNEFENNQTNKFNRYAALAGTGLQAATATGQFGAQTGANVSNTLMNLGHEVGQNLNNAGAARASGYIGNANAWTGALGGVTGALSLYQLLNQQQNPSGGSFI